LHNLDVFLLFFKPDGGESDEQAFGLLSFPNTTFGDSFAMFSQNYICLNASKIIYIVASSSRIRGFSSDIE
jgi:hypothetical protein